MQVHLCLSVLVFRRMFSLNIFLLKMKNKIMLVYHPGLLDAVINIANHDPIDEAREHAAIVLMNLAYAEENKVHMVNQDHLLDTLVHLLSDVSPFTRRYASAALFTLACTYANTAVMARHCDGGILEALRKGRVTPHYFDYTCDSLLLISYLSEIFR